MDDKSYPLPKIVADRGDIVVIVGPPVTGKTTMMNQLKAELIARHWDAIPPVAVVLLDEYVPKPGISTWRQLKMLSIGAVVVAVVEAKDMTDELGRLATVLIATTRGYAPTVNTNRLPN